MNTSTVVTIAAITLFALALSPLFLCARNSFNLFSKKSSKKLAVAINIISVFSVCVLIFAVSASSVIRADAAEESGSAQETAASGDNNMGLGLLAAALATGISGVGAGIAVASSASAAIGAISENPKVFTQALIFVALAEGIALYGLIISIQIFAKL